MIEQKLLLSRRQLLISGAASLALGGCDRISQAPTFQQFLSTAERLTYGFQRLVVSRAALAPEYGLKDIAKKFRPNGSQDAFNLPPDYPELAADNFARWRVEVGGLVMRPMTFSIADLRALPSRTQITRHDCVEGWSAIGQWQGVPLAFVLAKAQLLPAARFLVFHCADALAQTLDGTGQYYESIDLIDAFHPQTILAHSLNDAPLSVGHGAPLRLRVERQLGYKHAKYIMRIEVTERLDGIGRGKGGFWEDRGYEWYAGI